MHIDACLFSGALNSVDGQATFESSGVGTISACPGPDGAGPRTATLSSDGNRCTQSGWQVRGIAGDREFHARFNNTTTVGWQFVTLCHDPEANGCADTSVKALVAIYWGPN